VLSVFDIDWIEPDPDLDDTGEEELAEFLAGSCERVVDASGTARWQLRDDERARALRTHQKSELADVFYQTALRPRRPADPVQEALARYLGFGHYPGSRNTTALSELDAAALSAELQVVRWTGQESPAGPAEVIKARLEWLAVIEPLRRLADGFVGRGELMAESRAYLDGPDFSGNVASPAAPNRYFFIEGVGGSGKSAVLARLTLEQDARDDLAAYLSFDRGWLADSGPSALLDEIVRQVGAQARTPDAQEAARSLRQEVQRRSRRSKGWQDIASRGGQSQEGIHPLLLQAFRGLLADGRLMIVLDTMEELARRDDALSSAVFGFLRQLQGAARQVRVVGAGRALPAVAAAAGSVHRLTGLGTEDALTLLRRLTSGTALAGKTAITDGALREVIRLTSGNPLSLRIAADVLNRTGEDPARIIAVTEGNVQGQLYARLLEHIKDPKVRAIAHPGLVVRRITPEIIRDVLAGPCGIGPLPADEAARIFRALRAEATLCDDAPEGDGALVHRQDVRAIMLPAIQRDRPATTRAIHEAAASYYAGQPAGAVNRREELYHRLMLEQDTDVLDSWWNDAAGIELATVIDEFPPRGQVYLSTKVRGLRLDPEILATARNDEWARVVRPAALRRMDAGLPAEALALVRERRGADRGPLLPDLEVEAMERLGQVSEALSLAEQERARAELRGDPDLVRALITAQARLNERLRHPKRAWDLWQSLAALDRARRGRTSALDEEVRVRELIVLTSLLRVARQLRRSDRTVTELRAETIRLALGTPRRLLTDNPSLLRDLAAETGDDSPELLSLAESALHAGGPDESLVEPEIVDSSPGPGDPDLTPPDGVPLSPDWSMMAAPADTYDSPLTPPYGVPASQGPAYGGSAGAAPYPGQPQPGTPADAYYPPPAGGPPYSPAGSYQAVSDAAQGYVGRDRLSTRLRRWLTRLWRRARGPLG
jgi:hypothetical protein